MAPGFSPIRAMWAVLSAVLVLGATTARADGGGYGSEQGTHVFGHAWDDIPIPLASGKMQSTPVNAFIYLGQLEGSWNGGWKSGTNFVDVSFIATLNLNSHVTLTISDARPHTNVYDPSIVSTTVWEYRVTWQNGGVLSSLCPNNGYALAVPGHWDDGYFGFACLPGTDPSTNTLTGGGVAAKCVDWGYPPWLSNDLMPGGQGMSPATTAADAFKYHAACTAMAMADYCGENRTNTLNGTPILMFKSGDEHWDGPYIADGPFGPPPSDFYFETAWTAEQVGTNRYQGKAVCLSKKRWTTLSFNGACSAGGNLQDPRVDPGDFCEDLTVEDLRAQDAVLFSYSPYMDAGLYRFTNTLTNQSLTTTHVTIVGRTVKPAGIPNADAWTGPNGQPVFEGPVLSPRVRDRMPAFFNHLSTSSLRMLRRYGTTTTSFTTITTGMAPPNGYVDPLDEGYIYFGGSLPAAPQLHWWQNNLGYATSTTAQGIDQGTLGSLPEVGDYNNL